MNTTEVDLDAMTKDELLDYARQIGASPANAGMAKDDIRASIDARQEEDEETGAEDSPRDEIAAREREARELQVAADTEDGFALEEYGAEAVLESGPLPEPEAVEVEETEFDPADEHGAEAIYWEKVGDATTPTVDSIDPTSCPVGPPADVPLTVTGTGFDSTSQIAFGLDADGTPKFEASTRFVSDTELTIEITAGLFPNPDSNVEVLVGNVPPHGPVSNTVPFTIGP